MIMHRGIFQCCAFFLNFNQEILNPNLQRKIYFISQKYFSQKKQNHFIFFTNFILSLFPIRIRILKNNAKKQEQWKLLEK